MSDRNKVVRELEHMAGIINQYTDMLSVDCDSWVILDALELLKEQEPVKPIKSKLSFTHGFNWDIWDCGCCGNQLRSFAKYCDQCRRAVKWKE